MGVGTLRGVGLKGRLVEILLQGLHDVLLILIDPLRHTLKLPQPESHILCLAGAEILSLLLHHFFILCHLFSSYARI